MNNAFYNPTDVSLPLLVAAGEDRFGELKGIGISSVAFKVASPDSKELFVVEISLQHKGGPERHLHTNQDEWFYFLEGEFVIEVGDERLHPKPGDALLVKKQTPHVWAFVGEKRGRFLAAFTPAGNMAAFFQDASKANAAPGPNPDLWRPYGMEWLGSPLPVK